MENIGFIFREFGASEIIFVIFAIGLIAIYNWLIKPDLDELKEHKTNFRNKIDNFPSKDDIKDLISFNPSIINEIHIAINNIINQLSNLSDSNDRDITSLKLNFSDDVEKLHLLINELKTNLYNHHEELTVVREVADDIKKNCSTLYEVIDKTLDQLEAKGIIDRLERIDYHNLNKIQVSANEISTLAAILSEALDKSKPSRKLDRV